MSASNVNLTQNDNHVNAASATKVDQSFTVFAGKAMTFQPERAGIIRVAQGRVWVTVGHGVLAREQGYGDCFLAVGQQMAVRAGQSLVIEPLDMNAAASFNFVPSAGVNKALAAIFSIAKQPFTSKAISCTAAPQLA